MTEQLFADIAVVGAGFGGLSAALRAQELGADVVVFDRTSGHPSWSNSRMSGARFHIAGAPPWTPALQTAERVIRSGQGQLNEALVKAWISASNRAYRWTRDHGFRYVMLRGTPVMAPVRPNRPGNVWRGRGAEVSLKRLSDEFTAQGGRYLDGVAVETLHGNNNRVIGGVARPTGGARNLTFRSAAVIIADGGFQANGSLLRRHCGVQHPDRLIQRGAATGVGDGLTMAQNFGARIVNGDALYAHLVHREAVTNSAIRHYPMLDTLAAASLLVGPDGRRFCDERLGGIHAANHLARSADPLAAWIISDRRRWETAGRLHQIVPPNPNLLIQGAHVECTSHIDALSSHVGMSEGILRSTLESATNPLEPPYVAIPIAVGLTFTMGGLAINESAQVMNGSLPIDGLYAVGGSAGGLQGGPVPTYVSGIGAALTLGMLAGEHSAGASRSKHKRRTVTPL